MVGILSTVVPNLPKILVENDRILTAATAISANVIGPMLRSKGFPGDRYCDHARSAPGAGKITKQSEILEEGSRRRLQRCSVFQLQQRID